MPEGEAGGSGVRHPAVRPPVRPVPRDVRRTVAPGRGSRTGRAPVTAADRRSPTVHRSIPIRRRRVRARPRRPGCPTLTRCRTPAAERPARGPTATVDSSTRRRRRGLPLRSAVRPTDAVGPRAAQPGPRSSTADGTRAGRRAIAPRAAVRFRWRPAGVVPPVRRRRGTYRSGWRPARGTRRHVTRPVRARAWTAAPAVAGGWSRSWRSPVRRATAARPGRRWPHCPTRPARCDRPAWSDNGRRIPTATPADRRCVLRTRAGRNAAPPVDRRAVPGPCRAGSRTVVRRRTGR